MSCVKIARTKCVWVVILTLQGQKWRDLSQDFINKLPNHAFIPIIRAKRENCAIIAYIFCLLVQLQRLLKNIDVQKFRTDFIPMLGQKIK